MELEWVQRSETHWVLEQNFPASLYQVISHVRSTPVGWVVRNHNYMKYPSVYETCEEAKAMAVILIRMEAADGTQLSR